MKKLKIVLGSVLFFLVPMISTFGQPSPPSVSSGTAATGGNVLTCSPLSAPLTDGQWILIILAMGYAVYKFWQYKHQNKIA